MNNINLIDIEASGLHFDSYPIEVALLVNGQIRSWLIKPEPTWIYWSRTAENMHGITREFLIKEGVDAHKVASEMNIFFDRSNGVVYSDAVYWDADWIDTLFTGVRETRKFHIRSIYDLLEKDQITHFNTIKERLSQSGHFQQHRAEGDVCINLEAFQKALRLESSI